MKILVIGGSSGGFEALKALLREIDPSLPFAIFVVLHTSPDAPPLMAEILSSATGWRCEPARDGDRIRAGRVVVARPDHHLIVKPGRISTPRGPRENGFRPAIDPLFRSAADAYGDEVVGIVLSGGLDDGSHGLMLVKERGGITMVQDPAEAQVPSMPSSAIRAAVPHHVVPISRMPAILERLSAKRGVPEGVRIMSERKRKEKDVAERGDRALLTGSLPGPPSGFTCPDCGGALWELEDDRILRYRCHVGHAFNGKSLQNRSDEEMERALWTALRSLEESAALRRRMAERAQAGRLAGLAEGYQRSSRELESRAEVIRDVLLRDEPRAEAEEESSPRPRAATRRK